MVSGKHFKRIILLIFSLFLLSNCTSNGKMILRQKSFGELHSWQNDNHLDAINAFIKGCNKYDLKGWKKFSKKSSLTFSPKQYNHLCKIAQSHNHNDHSAKKYFEEYFVPYLVSSNNNDTGLFTGYHEPIIHVSAKRHGKFKYPIYSTPKDINKKRPYYDRKTIENGVLRNKKLEIAYTDDPIELFFLQIQGSGIMKYNNGKEIRIRYDSQNGHPYYPIGKYLIKNQYLTPEKVNAITIKNWLKKHPKKANQIMNLNKSYIFFKINQNQNIRGAQDVDLTAERSLAIDRKYLPLGALLWVEAKDKLQQKNHHKLMVSQDTGGAIKGIVRADIFFGSDKKAAYNAAMMKGIGRYYILMPKITTY